MSWTLILQSAAPVTTIESLEFGKNFKKNRKVYVFFAVQSFYPEMLHYIQLLLTLTENIFP